MHRTRFVRSASCGVGVALVVLIGGCSFERKAERLPDSLLVTIDTLRADHVGAYGGGASTPNLDALAAGGALFEVAYAPMGTTTPSHSTLFTARLPATHGVMRNGVPLDETTVTLAEHLRDAGFATAAFVSAFPLKRRWGLAQGFQHYDDDFSDARPTMPLREWEGGPVEGNFDRRGAATVDRAIAWLEGRGPEPLFVWVHLFDPHYPYRPPDHAMPATLPRSTVARERALYAAEVRYADAELGRLLAAFRARAVGPPPLIWVLSDHGEGLYDHGWRAHSRFLYDEEVRVPWVVHWEGRVPAGARLDPPAHLVDAVPTLLGLLEIDPADPGSEGVDLSPVLLGEGTSPVDRPLWLQRPYYVEGRPKYQESGPGFGLRIGRFKLVEAPGERRRELYDLETDPGERNDLSRREPQRTAALSARLGAWRQAHPLQAQAPDLTAEEIEALRALGYVD